MTTVTDPKKFEFVPWLISVLIVGVIGFIAAMVNLSQIHGWYSTLLKPWFNPPDNVFGPVWGVLYLLIATAAYLVWKRRDDSVNYRTARAVYIMQLTLNFSWSIVFFGLHSIMGGLVVIFLLWMSIFLNTRWFGKFSKLAGWLLLPYFLWVSFALALNLEIHFLNG